jgi:hypothetical protein
MNIRDYWPDVIPTSEKSTWMEFCQMRRNTFLGFARLEASRGFINPAVSVRTSQGQEIVRILALRVLEEIGEAYQSSEEAHFLEELIDAFNYLLSLHQYFGIQDEQIVSYLMTVSKESLGTRYRDEHRLPFLLNRIGEITLALGATLGDSLRNRAWMVHTQNSYFDGDLEKIFYPVYHTIFSYFEDFEHFASYFIAKDRVLQFRLRSKY